MNTKYTIKNFRVFDEKGVTVDINPITILTGCNSSGKSSIVKSMVLLNTYIESLQEDYNAFNRIDLQKHKLDFTKDSTITLGNFNRVRHNGSDEKTITFQYQVHSLYLGEDVIVSMVFGADENDALNNGYLLEISIIKLSGEIIYSSSKENPCQADYNLILHNFFRFAQGQFLVDWQGEYNHRYKGLYGLQTEEEFHNSQKDMPASLQKRNEESVKNIKAFKSALDTYYNSYITTYGEESLKDVKDLAGRNGNWRFLHALGLGEKGTTLIEQWAEGHPEIVNISLKWNTLFYFPLLEKLNDVDNKSFKKNLLDMLDGITNEKEVSLAIDKVSDDFEKSGERTFGDYFRMKEALFLKYNEKRHKRDAPYIYDIKYLNVDTIYNGKILAEGYMQWSRRMLGPAFTEWEGNLVSLIEMGEIEEWKKCPVDFNVLYDVMLNINHLLDRSESKFFYIKHDSLKERYHEFQHRLFSMFKNYTTMVLEEVITSAIPQNLSYIGTSLVNVKRDYSFDSNNSFTKLIKRYFIAQRTYKNSREKGILGPENFISKWVRKLGIGFSVSIEVSNSGSSFVVRLFKDEEDKVGNILAEEGYGITQIITLLIRIETAILESKKKVDVDDHEHPFCTFSESTIAVEEPEVHLHPRFQSILAEMFVDAYKNYNVHFIIETHSEYLIRKLQTLIAKNEVSNSAVSIIYIYDKENRPDSEPQVKRIGVSNKGMLLGRFGEGFFDEADELSLYLLMQQRKHD